MRKLLLSVALLSFSVSGADKYIGTITTTTANVSLSNSATAVPFTLVKGGRYMVQCDVESCVASVKTGSQDIKCSGVAGAATIANRVGQKMIYDLTLAAPDEFIAAVATTGATNCDVYAVTP
jgi:hypothetical protein